LTPANWRDLERLFGARGACNGCWCMWWRLTKPEFEAGRGAANRRALRALVAGGAPVGLLGYAGDTAIGWCALAPREDTPRLERARNLKRFDDAAVWSVTCLFVAPTARRRGVSVRLLRAAARLARRQGATILEGYPVEPRQRVADPWVWTGVVSAFQRAGFVEVHRRSAYQPIMRLHLGRRRGGVDAGTAARHDATLAAGPDATRRQRSTG